MSKVKASPLKFVNNILTIAVLLFAFYLIAGPFLPQASYAISEAVSRAPTDSKQKIAISKTNRLIIPKMKFNQAIQDGDISVLAQGLWRRPQSSTPSKGSNTVIVGHRFYRSRPAIFYHLDKIKEGDQILVDWQQKRYVYRVSTTTVVPPSAGYIENPTTDNILTLYTCTPLWTSKERLVVQAELQEILE